MGAGCALVVSCEDTFVVSAVWCPLFYFSIFCFCFVFFRFTVFGFVFFCAIGIVYFSLFVEVSMSKTGCSVGAAPSAPVSVLIRSAFSPRERVRISFVGPGRTQQSAKDECDVNLIVKRFISTGVLPEGTFKSPYFGDVTGLDFRAMMDVIAEANVAFAAQPAEIRRRFANDPQEFVDFCTNPENSEELVKMGLAERPKDRRSFVKGESRERRRGAPVAPPGGSEGGIIPPTPGAPAKGA